MRLAIDFEVSLIDAKLAASVVAIVGVPASVLGYILVVEWIIRHVPPRRQTALRPWLWLLPGLGFVLVFLVYPILHTVVLSLQDRAGDAIGLANYSYFFDTSETLGALRNSAVWLVGLTTLAVGGGLLLAALLDRVRYEAIAKSIVFMPMAISFVGAGVIWKFMLDFRPPGFAQAGTLNALLVGVGAEPVPWLIRAPLNTVLLIVVAAWISTGFSMVVLSASLKGINRELLDAGRVDGASESQLFRHVTLPLLKPTIGVLVTLMVIASLKAFDIVYVMTNGSFDSEVIANRMYKELFIHNEPGRASAVAVILLILLVPAMVLNVRQMRREANR